LKKAEAGLPVKELCRKHGLSDGSFYTCRSNFDGMKVPDAKRVEGAGAGECPAEAVTAETILSFVSLVRSV